MEQNGMESNGIDWNGIEYLIRQNFVGQNCRNFELVPKIFSAEILSYKLEWNRIEYKGIEWYRMKYNGIEEWNRRMEKNGIKWNKME